jgi:hypothetical protein
MTVATATTEKAKADRAKVQQTMHEFKHGTLHSGSKKGPKVTNHRQAIAIALHQAAKALADQSEKAANYGARQGQAIAGNLYRGAGGKFSGGSGGGAAAAKPEAAPSKKPDLRNQQRQARQDLTDAQRQERQQAKLEQARANVGDAAAKLLGDDMAEVLTTGDVPGDLSGVKPEYGDQLIAKGLATKYPDGSYDLSQTGRSMLRAMASGNERAAKIAIMRAQQLADRKAAAEAKRAAKPKKKRKETAGQMILRAYKAYSDKAHPPISVTARKETQAQGSFKAYKDHNGQWRWLAISSSGFEDRDGEIVSTKALTDDCARCDATSNYGPLDWWHTPIELGTCDFNAMHGGLLVESGTFHSPLVAERIAQAIATKQFEPGLSLTFEHSEPGPPVLPGRVFGNINKLGRSLLPAYKASNLASAIEVINPAIQGQSSNKEVAKKMLEQKIKQLETILGPDLVRGFLEGSEVSEKALQMAGIAYKAAAALDAPMTNAASPPADKKKLDTKAAPMSVDDLLGGAEDEAGAEDEEEAGEDPGDYEGSPSDQDTDAILQGFFDQVGKKVNGIVQVAVDQMMAAIASVGGTSEKEVSALTAVAVALKETSAALTGLGNENRALKETITALDRRLGALEGSQPPIVQRRASQGVGLLAADLPEAHQALVAKENQEADPYVGLASRMLASTLGNR